MALKNVTNTSSNPAVLNSSHSPTTHGLTAQTASSTEPQNLSPSTRKGLSTTIAPESTRPGKGSFISCKRNR